MRTIVTYDETPTSHNKNHISYNMLIGNTATEPVNGCSFDCAPQNMRDNVMLILCSSGTTGLPKGVQLTQYGVLVASSQH